MIAGSRFVPNEPFSYRSRTGVIRLFEEDLAVLKYDDGVVESTTPDVLREAHRNLDFCFTGNLSDPRVVILNDDEKAYANWLEPYLRAMDKLVRPTSEKALRPLIDEVAVINGHEDQPGFSTLCGKYRKWKLVGKCISRLVKKGERKRNRRIEKALYDLLVQSIEQDYLKPNVTAVSAHGLFEKRCIALDYVNPPSIDTYRKYITTEFDWLHVIAKREGPDAANAASRSCTAKIKVTRPLERVEIDTAHFNFGVFNKEGFFIGKIVLYLVIDCYSRAILGYVIHHGKGQEDASAAIQALRYAIARKCDPEVFPMEGLFTELVCDGGPAYIAAITQNFLRHIAFKTQISPIREGWGKPFIERFIGTLRTRFFSNLDAYLGKSDPKKYQDKRIIEAATLTLDAFEEELEHFIVHEYHHTPHAGLRNQTPFERWQEGVKNSPIVPVDELSDLNLLRGFPANSTLHRNNGFTFEYEWFRGAELSKIYDYLASKRKGSDPIKIDYFVDKNDASGVSVVDPRPGQNGKLINIKNKDWDIVERRSFYDLKLTLNERKNRAGQAPVTTDGKVHIKPRGKIKPPGTDAPYLDDEPELRASKPSFVAPNTIAPKADELELPISSISNNSFDEEDDYDFDS